MKRNKIKSFSLEGFPGQRASKTIYSTRTIFCVALRDHLYLEPDDDDGEATKEATKEATEEATEEATKEEEEGEEEETKRKKVYVYIDIDI